MIKTIAHVAEVCIRYRIPLTWKLQGLNEEETNTRIKAKLLLLKQSLVVAKTLQKTHRVPRAWE